LINRFYYDFFFPNGEQLSVENLAAIKKEMERIIKRNLPITREELTREEARLFLLFLLT
jgi:threonyl-tRNA synthetase